MDEPMTERVRRDPVDLGRVLGHVVRENVDKRIPDPELQTAARAAADRAMRLRRRDRLKAEAVIDELTRLCFVGGWQEVLIEHGVSFPAFSYFEDYESSIARPVSRPLPPRIRLDRTWNVLGFDVGLPIGVPASPLTANSRWIAFLAQAGFNVLTYKTVRTTRREPHPPPNWVFLDLPADEIELGEPIHGVGGIESWPKRRDSFSTANSFGVPSQDPQDWQQDVLAATKAVDNDQLLIVSVMGSPWVYQENQLVEDYARAARMAEEAGASAIELNLSCPNSIEGDGVTDRLICHSASATRRVVEAVRDGLLNASTRVVAKLAWMPRAQLREVIQGVASIVDGIASINSMQGEVVTTTGEPTFGEDRRLAGISGVAVRRHALGQVKELVRLRADLEAQFDVLGMGGVMSAADVLAFHGAGAAAVQTASAAFVDPSFAFDVTIELGDLLPSVPGGPTTATVRRVSLKSMRDRESATWQLVEALSRSGDDPVALGDLQRRISLPEPTVIKALDLAVENGLIEVVGSGGDARFALSVTGRAAVDVGT